MKSDEERIKEVLEAKKKFVKLSKKLSLEEFKKEADKYFEGKIAEMNDCIDLDLGTDLLIAIEMKKRYEIRWNRTKEATSNEKAFQAMFSPI